MILKRLRRKPYVELFVDKQGDGRFHLMYRNHRIGPVSEGYAPDKRDRSPEAQRASAVRAARRAAERDWPELEIVVRKEKQ